MRKKLLLPTLFISIAFSSFAQDVTGTWQGIFYDQQFRERVRTYYFFLELKQGNKEVDGVYNITIADNMKRSICLCSINADIPKKPDSQPEFYKDHIINETKSNAQYSYCNFLSRLETHFYIQDGTEYLTGRWYGDNNRLGGLFVVQHMTNRTLRDISTYFPKLKAETENSADKRPSFIGDPGKPIEVEQELIDALKKAAIH